MAKEVILPRMPVQRRKGTECITSAGSALDIQLVDFWRWAYSNILSNASRGVFAEFLVAAALGLAGGIRQEWDAADLILPSGIRIEVKSAAYLQTWAQKSYSRISFGIAPTLGWDAESNQYADEPLRNNDIYVFCLLAEKDPEIIDPLNLNQWRFYVLATSILDEQLGSQKTISLSRLLQLQPKEVSYDQLADALAGIAQMTIDE